MPDAPQLHELTAELHAAVDHPQRWRAAWLALNEFMGSAPAADGNLVRPAASGSTATACGADPEKRCQSAGIPSWRKSELAGVATQVAPGDGLPAMDCVLQTAYVAALDALPVAAWLCQENRNLLHANTAGVAELKRRRWFKLEADQLCASDRTLQQRLVSGFANLVATRTPDNSSGQPALQIKEGGLEVGLRRVAQSDGPALVLVSVAVGVNHGAEVPQGEQMAYWPERRLLSPRQRELAGLLLTFHSLDDAADKMGITRRTARDHLAGLFQATGMRRQQDLINFLRRGTLS